MREDEEDFILDLEIVFWFVFKLVIGWTFFLFLFFFLKERLQKVEVSFSIFFQQWAQR